MAIAKDLLEILVCPDERLPLQIAEESLIQKVNGLITEGTLENRGGHPVREPIESGLISSNRKYLYPIREDIPILLVDEAIKLENIA